MTRASYKMRLIPGDEEGRKAKVHVIHGVECMRVIYSGACSGCTEVPECTHAPDRGSGCHECGYTGRKRHDYFVPFDG